MRLFLCKVSLLPLWCLLFVVSSAKAQMPAARENANFDLYLLIGQSNMAGRGTITEEYRTEGSEAVMMFTKEGQWVQARHPLHFDKPTIAGVGPGLRFGVEMASATHHKIGLIPCAVGGTSIDAWQPGGYDKATNTHPYDEAMARLTKAMQSGKLKGVLWLQGESDSDTARAKEYRQKLVALIERIRRLAADSMLPFVAGELGRFKEQYASINKQLATLPEAVPYTAVASSEGLTDKGDQTHFDAPSADEYGKRLAQTMMALLQKLRPTRDQKKVK